jgi:hypothetical protein
VAVYDLAGRVELRGGVPETANPDTGSGDADVRLGQGVGRLVDT